MPVTAKWSAPPPLDIPRPDSFPSIDLQEIAKKNGIDLTPGMENPVQGMIDTFMSQISAAYRILDDIVHIQKNEAPTPGGRPRRTFQNTVEALDDFTNLMEEATNWPGFYAYVHPDPFVRAAGEAIDKYASRFMVEVGSSRDLYLALSNFAQSSPALSDEEKYILAENLRDFEDGGVALPPKNREKFKALSKEQSDLAIDFSSNVREYRDTLTVTLKQLEGMDTDYIEGLEKTAEGNYVLTLDYPQFMPYMDYGRDEDVRRILLTKFRNRAKDKNIAILDKIIRLRKEKTRLLGRKTYADYVISRRMAKTADRAAAFLQDMGRRVDQKAAREMSEITVLKREFTGKPNATFEQWDRMFYSKLLAQRKFDYDPQQVKEYFQTDRVIQALLDISQKIYDLEFTRVPGTYWHEDVIKYDVHSHGEKIAEFYMDLYPRPNKYKHAAAWGIRPHKIFSDGAIRPASETPALGAAERLIRPSTAPRDASPVHGDRRVQLPVSAVVTNFPKPAPDRPSLLSFDDVETFFHEFGHLLHGILSTTRFAQVSGTRVMRDFVEAPSQMFEKWVHDTSVLSTFARHHKTGETIPAELVDRIVKSRNVVSGIETQRQLFYGIYDLTLHTSRRAPDVVKLWFDLKKEIERMEEIPGTCGPAGFDHLMGYGAGYYGYMWSRMISSDMYETIRDNGGLMSPEQGVRLRNILLSPGGSKHPDDLVKTFLGRPPKIDAFLRDLGIEE